MLRTLSVPISKWRAPAAVTTATLLAIGMLLATTQQPAAAQQATPVINEFGFSDASTDDEFVELYGDPNTDYSAYTFLQIDGDTADGDIDHVVAVGTTDANGIWATTVPSNSFENGSSTLLLVEGFTGVDGDTLDTDDDGVLDVTPWIAIADGVAIDDGGDADAAYATPVLDQFFDDARLDNPFAPGGASRIPDGVDTDSPLDWYRNDFSWDGITNGSPESGEALNTPGAPNDFVAPPTPAILINEIDADQSGTDSAEFVELASSGIGGTALDGLTLVFFNGSNISSYQAFDLDGFSTDADGYFVLCGDAANVAGCDLDVAPDTNLIQNGADAVALYEADAADFPAGTAPTTTGLVDLVPYDTNDDDVPELLAFLAAGDQINEAANGSSTTDSIARCPDGAGGGTDTTDFAVVAPSPGASNDAGCDDGGGVEPTTVLINEIQGAGDASPLDGQLVRTSGIVVGDFQEISTDDPDDEPLDGFFLQSEDLAADSDPATSEGIFVYAPGSIDVSVGDEVRVTGVVDEFFGLTEITNVSLIEIVGTDRPLPTAATPTVPISVTDPAVDWEAIEGMRVAFNQPLYVTGMFRLGAYGELQLSAIGAQRHPNQIMAFGSLEAEEQRALNLASRVILDDGEDENESFPSGISTWNPNPTPYLGGDDNTLRHFDAVNNLEGVVHYAWNEFEIHPVNVADPLDPDGAVSITRTPRPTEVPDVGGSLQVAAFNVLNYFTTLDIADGGCGPNGDLGCRGADTQAEFDIQAAKIADAIADLDVDIVGLIELQNSGSDAAIADLVAKVNAISARTYTYLPTGFVGNDAIAVGYIYDTATVETSGDFAILDSSVSPAFLDDKNRAALAQTFTELASGKSITLANNHLKSKGSSCDDLANPGDPAFGVAPYAIGDDVERSFEGSCNLTRTSAAQVLGQWLAADPTGTDADYAMIIGDLNAYAQEDPITALEALGWADLVEEFTEPFGSGDGNYSYVFDGELGTLDYAMADAATTAVVTGAAAWHINADEPFAIDYQNFNPAGQATLDEWKSSDHDPIVVGLNFAVDVVEPFACSVDAGVLSWTDDGQSLYWVYKSLDDGLTYDWIGRTLGATSFTDTAPAIGARYQVHYDGIPRVDCTIEAEPTTPPFTCSVDAGFVTWTDDGVDRYWIYRSTDGGLTYDFAGRTFGATSKQDPQPAIGALYQVHHAGIARVDCEVISEPSASLVLLCTVEGATLRWTDAEAAKYWVYRSTDGGKDYSWIGRTLGETTFTDPEPVDGARYRVHYAGIPRRDCAIAE